jgi:5S rRNA maturation endonuclease (ribonuclease M5)
MPKNLETSALAFAAYLHATSRLRYLAAVPPKHNEAGVFVFSDPKNEGEELRKEFENRKCFVEPRAFHQSLRNLRADLTKDTEEYANSHS